MNNERKGTKMAEKLVVYDSVFGNTAKVAQAMGEALGGVPVKKVNEVQPADLEDLKILIVGSPTRAFRATPATMTFLKGLKSGSLQGVKAAAFDTRIPFERAKPAFLRLMIRLFGYADTKIAKALNKAGASLPLESAGFGVTDTEGPLIEGELERAEAWAKKIL
jgi:flavodoxin